MKKKRLRNEGQSSTSNNQSDSTTSSFSTCNGTSCSNINKNENTTDNEVGKIITSIIDDNDGDVYSDEEELLDTIAQSQIIAYKCFKNKHNSKKFVQKFLLKPKV